MVFHIAINDIEPDHWVAWVLDLHGCFSKGKTYEEAVTLVPEVIRGYFQWLLKHDPLTVVFDGPIKIEIVEDIRSYAVDDYFVNALFEHDKNGLKESDLNEIRKILSYSRKDLIEVIADLSDSQLNEPVQGEVTGSIAGVIKHIATAELWYFDRIGLTFPGEKYPDNLMDLLKISRNHTLENLPRLSGDITVHEKRNELWTARKVMRRTLWHEIAHARQIERYKERLRGL